MLGELDKKEDAHGGPLQMLITGSDSVLGPTIADWPEHLVVVASHGGDPYALDLSQSNGSDAPILIAEHGAGVWAFERVFDSFVQFLVSLTR
jgi:hypothetical protein